MINITILLFAPSAGNTPSSGKEEETEEGEQDVGCTVALLHVYMNVYGKRKNARCRCIPSRYTQSVTYLSVCRSSIRAMCIKVAEPITGIQVKILHYIL